MNNLQNKMHLFDKDMAIILASLAYHISPEIVKYIVEQNKKDFDFFEALFKDKIDISSYLFKGSDCVFPGIRRYVSGDGKKQKYNPEYRAIIDDNIFPRHIWCYLVNGQCYSSNNWKKTKLNEFELAHIFTHKETEIEIEKKFFIDIDDNLLPHGEFTSAANVVLLPKGTTKPTDASPIIKSIFYKRYIDLYGEDTLNGRKGFIVDNVPEWYPQLKWNEPFLPKNWKENVDKLLQYRKKRIKNILDPKSKNEEKVISEDNELSEVIRVKKKIPKWFRNKDQFNSKILYAYLKLYEKNKNVLYTDLEQEADIPTFRATFIQMKNISPNNNGKIFERNDDMVVLWEKVENFILDYYIKYVKQR